MHRCEGRTCCIDRWGVHQLYPRFPLCHKLRSTTKRFPSASGSRCIWQTNHGDDHDTTLMIDTTQCLDLLFLDNQDMTGALCIQQHCNQVRTETTTLRQDKHNNGEVWPCRQIASLVDLIGISGLLRMQIVDSPILSSITGYSVVLAKLPSCRQISRVWDCPVEGWARQVANHQSTGRQPPLQRCTHKMKDT